MNCTRFAMKLLSALPLRASNLQHYNFQSGAIETKLLVFHDTLLLHDQTRQAQ